jgi:hypothetical protein
MRAGQPFRFDLALFDAAGTGLSYANAAAFEAASWALTFIDLSTGSAVSPTISYTIAPVAGVEGRHTVALTLNSSAWFMRVTPPSTSHGFQILPSALWDGSTYDADTLFARINSVYGLTTTTAVPGVALNDMVEGDSYLTTITVPTSYLSRMGWTDLTGKTLTGTIRRPADTTIGTPAATRGGTTPFVEINGTDPTAFNIRWDTYPAGMVLTSDERTAGSVRFRVEVQAEAGGKTLTLIYNAPLVVYREDNNA